MRHDRRNNKTGLGRLLKMDMIQIDQHMINSEEAKTHSYNYKWQTANLVFLLDFNTSTLLYIY